MRYLLLLSPFLIGGGPQEDADAALALAKARMPIAVEAPSEWMVTWIGSPASALPGVELQSLATLQGYRSGDVAVSGPWHNGRHVVYATLSNPTEKQIEVALVEARETWELEKARNGLMAFPKVGGTVQRDDSFEAGPLPIGFDISGMVRYKRAQNSQSIIVLNNRDSITPVSRSLLDSHWRQSGGMDGLSGFRSDLYKNDAEPQVWVGDIQVKNSFGFYQPNRGFKSLWPDGSRFLDVLSTDRGVFEIRQRLKRNGKWDSSVLFMEEKARPKGYNGTLARSCNSCHSESGSGAYGLGLVPGGDGVISFPFTELEK